MDKHFQLIVIGAGPGGYVAAIKAAKLGIETAVIEARDVGGTCLNRGCIPAKAMIHASDVYEEALHSDQFGVFVKDVTFDYEKIVEYKEETISKLVNGVEALFNGNGVTLIRGRGKLEADKVVCVTDIAGNETRYSADNIILAAGSEPIMLPIPGIDLPGVISSDGLFELREQPESLVIIGGGVIGVEFANAFSKLGTKVTIIEGMAQILPNMDKEIGQSLRMVMKKLGVDIYNNAMVQGIEKVDDGLAVRFVQKDKELSVSGQYVLCAVGRKPLTENLFAEGVDIEMTRGRVVVDEKFQSSIPGVYAIGDCILGLQLAHTASAQGIAVVEELAGHEPSVNINVVPGCVYTTPEIASVGLTEDDAKKQGIEVSVGKYITTSNGKSLISRKDRGFIKIIADKETHAILGCQMMCARATDMITEMSTAIVNGWTVEQMQRAMHPHPTYNEAVGEALEEITGGAIHIMPKKKRK